MRQIPIVEVHLQLPRDEHKRFVDGVAHALKNFPGLAMESSHFHSSRVTLRQDDSIRTALLTDWNCEVLDAMMSHDHKPLAFRRALGPLSGHEKSLLPITLYQIFREKSTSRPGQYNLAE